MAKPLGLILAGGQSLRLFPRRLPKPLLSVDGQTLLAQALERLSGFQTYVICNAEIARVVRREFAKRRLKSPDFILEPEGRDTAAAVGFGIREGQRRAPRADWVAVLSADQWIPERQVFREFLKGVAHEVDKFPHSLFVAGSPASSKRPEAYSQFGWIEASGKMDGPSAPVKRFVEKPDAERLQSLLQDNALVNAGMFFGRTATFLEAFRKHYPDVLNLKVKYKTLPRQPVDRAIFENFADVRVLPQPARWEDLGTWEDWYDHVRAFREVSGVKLHARSAAHAKAVKIAGSGARILVATETLKEVHTYGVSDLAIVEDESRLLVMPLSQSRNLKKFLEGAAISTEIVWTETRPWGRFKNLFESDFCKVKIIEVDPDRRLSYQSHRQRRESWTVVSGSAHIVLDDQAYDLRPGEHIEIPLQAKHRLENRSQTPLRIIEVQTGTYFGEDDITRYQDDFGRG